MSKLYDPETPLHWALFHSLESDLIEISRNIEFCEKHYHVYSVELTRLLLSIGAEVDSVAKELCRIIDHKKKPKDIDKYREIITSEWPKLYDVTVCFSRYNLKFQPWKNWKNNDSPQWWKDHNKVKHERSKNYDKANLGNVLEGLAGLFCLCCYLYKNKLSKGAISPAANILYFDEPFTYAMCVTEIGTFTTSIEFPPQS